MIAEKHFYLRLTVPAGELRVRTYVTPVLSFDPAVLRDTRDGRQISSWYVFELVIVARVALDPICREHHKGLGSGSPFDRADHSQHVALGP